MASSISKGTLNLRFMQNAQPKEKDIKAEVTAATIRDESEWEVSKDVRDAWGIGSEPSSGSMVAHEASYLPFVFSRSDDASGSSPPAARLRGRRTWNKRGEEVTEEAEPNEAARPPSSAQHGASGASKRRTAISGFGGGSAPAAGSAARSDPRLPPRSGKTAKELVREAGALPAKREAKEECNAPYPARSTSPSPPRFLRPAGVDAPSDRVTRGRGSRQQPVAAADTIPGARPPNLKRERDDRGEVPAEPAAGAAPAADKRHKKKKASAASASE